MLANMRHAVRARRRSRVGFTLVEMLVAMTCTLLLMLAITQTFQSIGEVSSRGRAAIELSTQLRGVQHRLHKDLEGLTVPVRPWPDATSAEGYFMIYEGINSDVPTVTNPGDDLYGDFDDIWAMTVRSTGEPFVGMYNGQMIQSQVAEVIWFTAFVDRDNNGTFTQGIDPLTLNRRVLLVRPDLNDVTTGELTGWTVGQRLEFWQTNDVSVSSRPNGTNLTANSLADLTQRENRFAHSWPFPGALSYVNYGGTYTFLNRNLMLLGNRQGEDVMLSSLLAADIRVYDRTALVKTDANGVEAISPGDPSYDTAAVNIGRGAYVDLQYVRNHPTANSEFSGASQTKSGLGGAAIYDTWSYWYEHDGIDQDDNNTLIDEGTNGLDETTDGVDDVGERETSPPYPIPLRGVQVRIRVLEPETQQVRQATVVQDFIPE